MLAMIIAIYLLIFGFFTSPVVASSPLEIYVSPNGSDTNVGDINNPLASLEAAKLKIRNIPTQSSDIRVFVRGGTYQINSPIVFDKSDSGKNGFSIIYENYPGETPLLSGGKILKGWHQEGKLWKVLVGGDIVSRQLFVNGNRAIRARSENANGIVAPLSDGRHGYMINNAAMSQWRNPQNIEFVIRKMWTELRCQAEIITESEVILKSPCGHNLDLLQNSYPTTLPEHGTMPSYVENAFELLDKPGEWYLDQASGVVYYYPRNGDVIEQSVGILPTAEKLIVINGAANDPVTKLKFVGLTFQYTTWLGPNTGDGFVEFIGNNIFFGQEFTSRFEGQVKSKKPEGAIEIAGGNSLVFDRNVFYRLGASAITFRSGSANNVFTRNRIVDISGGGIELGDFYLKVPVIGGIPYITKNNEISNNMIYKIGRDYAGGIGIQATCGENNTIRNNEIFETNYSGITIRNCGISGMEGPAVAKNNKIFRNYIHNVMNVLRDGGGIYSHSQQTGNEYSYNLITEDHNEYAALYLDDMSEGITLHHNVLFNNARSLIVKGGGHTISDNWWQDRGDWNGHPDIWWYQEPTGCGKNKTLVCSANNISNNHVITTLGQAPQDIVNGAGIEATTKDIFELKGDYNRDKIVDKIDLNLLITNFNIDQGYNIFNFSDVVANFGKF